MRHHYHVIEFKTVDDKKIPYLHGKALEKGEKLEVLLHDGHCQHGHVLLHEFCCDGKLQPFMEVCFHGEKPWIYLIGKKARRG